MLIMFIFTTISLEKGITAESDKVCMYEEMMTNNDNVESSLLTSNLLKFCVLYDVCCPSDKCGEHIALYRAIVYYYLTGSIMGFSLRVTRAGVAG